MLPLTRDISRVHLLPPYHLWLPANSLLNPSYPKNNVSPLSPNSTSFQTPPLPPLQKRRRLRLYLSNCTEKIQAKETTKTKKRQWLTALRRRFRRGEKPPVRIHGRAHAPREKSRLERRVGCHL